MAAAVSDARPTEKSQEKIKKSDFNSITLTQNPDLLASLPAHSSHQVVVAFAAETDGDLVQVAREKMTRKGSDLIYLNNVSGGAIFGSTNTTGSIIDKTGIIEEFTNVSKENLAHALINHSISKVDKLG